MANNEPGLVRVHRRREHPFDTGQVKAAILGIRMISLHQKGKCRQKAHQHDCLTTLRRNSAA
jgi:hypothetical protein